MLQTQDTRTVTMYKGQFPIYKAPYTTKEQRMSLKRRNMARIVTRLMEIKASQQTSFFLVKETANDVFRIYRM